MARIKGELPLLSFRRYS